MSGSWTIDQAVRARWDERNLDQAFRAYWRNQSEANFQAFQDGDARPNAPLPYAIWGKTVPVKIGESASVPGEAGKLVEYWNVPCQFTIHAATTTGANKKSGKEIAAALAKLVVAAYEDEAGALDIGEDDCHVQTIIGPDFCTREDDDVWMWVVQFDVQIERRRSIRGVA